jgi:hypothetical protein
MNGVDVCLVETVERVVQRTEAGFAIVVGVPNDRAVHALE